MLLAVFGKLKPKGNAMQRFQQKMLLESILMEMKQGKKSSSFHWDSGVSLLVSLGKLAINHFEK